MYVGNLIRESIVFYALENIFLSCIFCHLIGHLFDDLNVSFAVLSSNRLYRYLLS